MLWRCVRSILAACVLAALLGAAPAAAQDDLGDDPTFPGGPGGDVLLDENGFPIEGGEVFGFPGQEGDPFLGAPDPASYEYPPEYDIDLPEVEHDGLGLAYNFELGTAYDPVPPAVVIDLVTGAATFYDTGAPLPPVPLDLLTYGADGSLRQNVFTPGAQDDNAGVQAEGAPQSGGDEPFDFTAEDPVLSLYGTDYTAEDLAPYAFDTSELPEGALDDYFQFVTYEIALLFEMGVFNRGTPWYDTFAEIHAQFDLGDTQDLNLVQTFAAVDQEFARRSSLYQRALDPSTDYFVAWPVDSLDNRMYQKLAAGDWSFIIGYEYAAGLMRAIATGANTDLLGTGAAANIQLETALADVIEELEIQQDLNELLRADVDELRNQVALLSRPEMRAVLPEADGDLRGSVDGGEGDLILYSAIAGLAALLVLGALFFFLRGRREREGAPDPLQFDSDAAMATNQLLAGARDEDDILRILGRAAETQIGHPTTLFHAVTDGLQPVGSQTILTGSDLNRVVTTGQRAMTILRDDPAFPGETRAVIALPVIHGGKVQAVLTTHREGDTPFTGKDLLRLEPIAPALGGALERSAELGTLTRLAMVDGLTSLGNRRRLDGDLEVTIANAVAGDAPLGFAMIDVDHFKTFNDTHGHSAGDDVLRKVASTIAKCVRESDVVYRYGGEEFSMLLPGATPEEAAHVAERVRAAVEMEEFPGEEMQPGGKLTISVGVATLDSGSADDIRERADQALYRAKENGRNQVAYA